MARPFLKWAGGKGKLAPTILAAAPPAIARYIEPFAGAGAVFFALEEARPGMPALLADANPELIETYTVLRDELAALDNALALMAAEYAAGDIEQRGTMYYRVRASAPDSPAARAARFIFLNRTCYNGLYRVNRRGAFNVPMGRYDRPRIVDRENLLAVATALRGVAIEAADFEAVTEGAGPGDLLYLDPPYHPLSETSAFTSYTAGGFGVGEQRRLARVFEKLSRLGAFVILSNSSSDLVRELYESLDPHPRIDEVQVPRAINSKGTSRGPVAELLIHSAPSDSA